GQDHLVPLVGLPGVAEPGELADGPGAAAVAGGVQSAGVGELPRPADPLEPGHLGALRRPVDRVDLLAGERGEVGVAGARRVVALLPAGAARLDLVAGRHTPIVGLPTNFRQGSAPAGSRRAQPAAEPGSGKSPKPTRSLTKERCIS